MLYRSNSADLAQGNFKKTEDCYQTTGARLFDSRVGSTGRLLFFLTILEYSSISSSTIFSKRRYTRYRGPFDSFVLRDRNKFLSFRLPSVKRPPKLPNFRAPNSPSKIVFLTVHGTQSSVAVLKFRTVAVRLGFLNHGECRRRTVRNPDPSPSSLPSNGVVDAFDTSFGRRLRPENGRFVALTGAYDRCTCGFRL